MTQADIFSINVDDLADCTCRMGTVFGGNYWDDPPTTSPEDCEAHRNDVNQRKPTRASLSFARDMERLRLARPPARPPFVAPPSWHVDMTSHNAICARIDRAYTSGPLTPVEDEQRPKCRCCVWPDGS